MRDEYTHLVNFHSGTAMKNPNGLVQRRGKLFFFESLCASYSPSLGSIKHIQIRFVGIQPLPHIDGKITFHSYTYTLRDTMLENSFELRTPQCENAISFFSNSLRFQDLSDGFPSHPEF